MSPGRRGIISYLSSLPAALPNAAIISKTLLPLPVPEEESGCERFCEHADRDRNL